MSSSAEKPARRDWFVPALAGVSVLAFALRVAFIGAESLWNDELSTVSFTSAGPIQAVVRAAADTGPPLYYVLQSVVSAVVPTSEWSIRVISAIAGALLVFAVGLVGRRLYGAVAGIAAATGVAIGYRLIYFSQEGRAYMLGALLVTLVALTLLRALDRPRPLEFALLGLALVAAAYTHLFALIAAAGIVLGVLLRPRLVRRLGWPLAATLGVAVVAWLPWAWVLVQQASKVAGFEAQGTWVLSPPASIPAEVIDAFRTYTPWGGGNWIGLGLFAALIVAGVVLGGRLALPGGPASTTADMPERPADDAGSPEPGFALTHVDATSITAFWIAMVVLGGLLVSRFVLPIYDWRMAVMAAPAMFLLAGNGLARIWRPAAIIVAAVFVVAAITGLPQYYREPEKQQWREATQTLLEHDAEADGIFTYPRFLLKNADLYARILGETDGLTAVQLDRTKDLDSVVHRIRYHGTTKDGSFWLVEANVPFAPGMRSALDEALLKSGWEVAEEYLYDEIVVRHYRRSASRSRTGANQWARQL